MRQMNRKKRDIAGSSMVEIIAAFLILILVAGFFSRCILMAGRIVGISEEKLRASENLIKEYYLEETGADSAMYVREETVTLRFEDRGGAGKFRLDAVLREFRDESGVLYDVIPATGEAGGEGEKGI